MLMNDLHNKVSHPYSNHPNQNIVRLCKDQTTCLALYRQAELQHEKDRAKTETVGSLPRSCKRQDVRLLNNRILPPHTRNSWAGDADMMK